jgi:hypothetical protein
MSAPNSSRTGWYHNDRYAYCLLLVDVNQTDRHAPPVRPDLPTVSRIMHKHCMPRPPTELSNASLLILSNWKCHNSHEAPKGLRRSKHNSSMPGDPPQTSPSKSVTFSAGLARGSTLCQLVIISGRIAAKEAPIAKTHQASAPSHKALDTGRVPRSCAMCVSVAAQKNSPTQSEAKHPEPPPSPPPPKKKGLVYPAFADMSWMWAGMHPFSELMQPPPFEARDKA